MISTLKETISSLFVLSEYVLCECLSKKKPWDCKVALKKYEIPCYLQLHILRNQDFLNTVQQYF